MIKHRYTCASSCRVWIVERIKVDKLNPEKAKETKRLLHYIRGHSLLIELWKASFYFRFLLLKIVIPVKSNVIKFCSIYFYPNVTINTIFCSNQWFTSIVSELVQLFQNRILVVSALFFCCIIISD